MKITAVLGAACAAAVLVCAPAAAQTTAYPSKTVRVVIAWPPGGANDLAGRVIFQRLSQQLGQQFVIDNRAGAAGTIGADIVAKSPADGYTLLIHSTTHVSNPWLYKSLPYDTMKDFAPVTLLVNQPSVLTVHPSLPVKSVKELIALAKARPGQLNYSSSGNGSAPHLNMALFEEMAKVKFTHVPYKGGAPSVTAVLSGEAQVLYGTLASMMAQIQAGKLRAIAVSSSQRLKTVPQLPTMAEAGVPGYDMNAWVGLLAPANTPRDVVEKLNREIAKVQQMPDIVQALGTQGAEPWLTTPEQFAKRLREDHEKYGRLVKLTGAQAN